MIVGITGRKGSGKTTAGLALQDAGFRKMSFATTLKKMCIVLLLDLGYTKKDAEGLIHGRPGYDRDDIIPELGVSSRWLMQSLGTEWGRNLINPDIWVTTVAQELIVEAPERAVFDDVRFENEARMVRQQGGQIIHLTGRGDEDSDHESEQGVEVKPEDTTVVNDGGRVKLFNDIFDASGLCNDS